MSGAGSGGTLGLPHLGPALLHPFIGNAKQSASSPPVYPTFLKPGSAGGLGRTDGKDQPGGKALDHKWPDLKGHPSPFPIQVVDPKSRPGPTAGAEYGLSHVPGDWAFRAGEVPPGPLYLCIQGLVNCV